MGKLYFAVYNDQTEIAEASDESGRPILASTHAFASEAELRMYVSHSITYEVVTAEISDEAFTSLMLYPAFGK